MDILTILKAHNIDAEAAETLEAAIKKDIRTSFIPKTQYNKKVQELDAIKTEADDLKARAEAPNEFEGKYNDALKKLEALQGDYDAYKKGIETKELKNNIDSKVTKLLNDEGYTNEKVVNLLLKNLDYDNISIAEEGLKGFDLSAFTEGYEEFKTVRNTEGTPAINPPAVTGAEENDAFLMGYN